MKVAELTYEQLNEVISYDPENGAFSWKINSGKNIKAGNSAGTWKGMRNKSTGDVKRYFYIIYLGREMTAARVAWLLYYKEWPETVVQFVDGDNNNFKISNLKLAMFKSNRVVKDGRYHNTMSKDAARHYGLKRHYGISLTEYTEMYNSQNGKCAICGQPETSMLHGKIRDLSVDHCHTTGKIRQLLCNSCNHILGESKEDKEILLAAIAYLEKHSANKNTETSSLADMAPED